MRISLIFLNTIFIHEVQNFTIDVFTNLASQAILKLDKWILEILNNRSISNFNMVLNFKPV